MKIKIDENFKRGENGFYFHPQMPEWDESTDIKLISYWHKENECTTIKINAEDDASEEFLEKWFVKGIGDCSEWKPECNKHGAILIAIYDTEDGPVAIYAIPVENKTSIVSYKADSTGFFANREPSDGENQPHLVRLSAVKYVNGEAVSEFNQVILPDGWIIPNETIAFHGVTQLHANGQGVSESEVIKLFLNFCEGSTLITPSKYFNKRIIRIATKRYLHISVADMWNDNKDHFCILSQAKKQWGMKKLTLEEAAKTLEIDYTKGDSLLDAQTAAKIYFAMNK